MRRSLAWLLSLVLCLGMLPGAALAAETTYTKVTSADEFTTGQYYMVTDTGYAPGVLDDNWVTAVKVTEGSAPDAIWTLTVDGTTVKIQDANSTYIAPKGGNNNGITSGEYTWSWNFENGVFTFSGQGDDTVVLASNEGSDNKFRAYKTTTVEGNPNGYPSEFTLYKAENGSEPGGDVTVATPQASPQAGAVTSGTEITLTCATSGASIYYTLNGDDPTTSSAQYSDDNKPKIEGTVGAEVILKAVAVLEGVSSAVQTLQYTIEEDQPATEAPIEDGDQVVIYNPGSGMAMSADAVATYYRAGKSVTVSNGEIEGPIAEDLIWEVTENADGTFIFSNNGDNISINDNNNSLPLNDKNDDWRIEAATTYGCYYIINVECGTYVEYQKYNGTDEFTTYGYQANNESAFAMQFIKVKDEGGDEPDPQPTSATLMENAPKAGDVVLIYYPTGSKVMSTQSYTYTSSSSENSKDELVALDATASDGTMPDIPDGTALFQVYEQNGHLVFKSADGYLYLDGTNVRLVEDLGEYTCFDLETAEGGWFIKSTNAEYNGNPQYLEFYGGYFTCFGMNNSRPEIYTFQFYKAGTFDPSEDPLPGGGTTVEAPFEDGDTVVIYAPAYNKALSGEYTGHYNNGTDVTVGTDGTLAGYTNADIWTVIDNGDGTWSFSYDGQNLGMQDSYSSMPLGAEHDNWVLEEAADDCWYVKNTERELYIEWYDSKGNWSAYGAIASGSEGMFALKFYQTEMISEGDPDEPEVEGLEVRATPASGASVEAGDTIELAAADGATIYYTTDGTEPTTSSTVYTGAITLGDGEGQVPAPTSGLPLVIKAIAVLPGDETTGTVEQVGDVCTFTYQAPVTLDGYQLYFGQLHSHTNISDGAGSVEEAFEHAAGVDNLDFLAVTDHSNSFDNASHASVDLGADLTGVSSEWAQGHTAADEITDETFVGIYGFEMTWSGGFGHINTFNTPGFESRNNDEFENNPTGHVNYYNKLVEVEGSLSQFNHPGTTFGDFGDFAYYTPRYDERINLIEVGNGEGAIGASGYFPSYEYYTRALDKGWHVAPTNNQDNHKGNWGDSNTARSVVLAKELTRDAIYDAIANHRVYATEDNDLSILYSLNDNIMGSILPEQGSVTITAQISDPTDTGDMTVEVVVNGGLVIGTQTVSGGKGTVNFRFDSNDYSYYYLRITQADQNIAVTAPVWTGESVNAGISTTECDTVLVVKDEEVNISSELFNNSGSDMTVTSLVFTVDDEDIYTANVSEIGTAGVIASGGTATVSFPHTFTSGGATTVEATMVAIIDGTEHTFTSVLQLTVTDESLVTRVLVDGTHWNDYVNGYYSGNMGNFTQLAADMNAQVTIQQPGDPITADDLKDVALLVISAPLKYDGRDNLPEGATQSTFSQEFINMVANYAKEGGTVILCGLADYQDNNDGAPYCSTEQINPILEAMGSTLRLNDDEVLDDDTNYNGGSEQTYRVYMDDFNVEAFPELFEGLQEGQRYSAYSGCSVDLGENGVAIVRGSANCYSINSKTRPDGAKGEWDSGELQGSTTSGSYDPDTAVVTKGNVVTLATEAVGSGRVYVAGTVFLSDFEISDSSSVDYGDASYANKIILENILSGLLEEPTVSTIAQARAGQDGDIFTVEGTVVAGSVEPNAFFDCIYIQDETGAICLHPVNNTVGTFRVGQTVRATGYRGDYQGDVQLGQVISAEVIDETENPIAPANLSLSTALDYNENGGKLTRVSGTVESVEAVSGQISTVILTDGANDFRLLFNNYIGYSDETSPDITTFVKEGAEISAVGVIYMDPEGVCLRVRDLSEVTEESSSTNTGSSSVTRYTITVEDADHGSVKSSMRRASRGTTVTLTATPDEGYELESITVTRSGGTVSLTDKGDGKYTFTMPRANVTVEAVFTASGEQPGDTGLPFTDVDADDWFHDAVTYVYENGMMEGTSDTAFSPSMTTTRGMIVTILWRLEDSPEADGQTGFTDVADGAWYADAVNWAAGQDIVEGYNGGFGPEDIITREQMALILYRYAQYKGYDTSATDALNGFADAGAVSGWAEDAVAWAVGAGLMEGKGGDVLDPAGTATRAEAAAILARFCQNIAE